MEARNNWGRWGKADERGALNLLVPEVIRDAGRLIKRGEVFSLAIPIAQKGQPCVDSRVPTLHLMALDGGDYAAGVHLPDGMQYADDYILMATHGTTHVDALAHSFSDGKLYNDHDASRVRSYGATRCGIEKAGPIVGRGVLLDVASFKGVRHLSKPYVITPEDLSGCADWSGIAVQQADIVLIRTGWLNVFYENPQEAYAGWAGIGMAAGRWLVEHDICAVGADNIGAEMADGHEHEGGTKAAIVHTLLIRDNGIYVMELLNLEGLAKAKVYEFLFVAAPLQIVGGVGSPLNPLAIA